MNHRQRIIKFLIQIKKKPKLFLRSRQGEEHRTEIGKSTNKPEQSPPNWPKTEGKRNGSEPDLKDPLVHDDDRDIEHPPLEDGEHGAKHPPIRRLAVLHPSHFRSESPQLRARRRPRRRAAAETGESEEIKDGDGASKLRIKPTRPFPRPPPRNPKRKRDRRLL